MFGVLLFALLVQVPGYGTDVSVAGGSLGMALYRPGWEGGVPKEAYEVTTSWTQDGADACGTYRVRFKRDLDLECVGLSWTVGATQTAGREWTADGAGGQILGRFVRIGLGGGAARRFAFPLPETARSRLRSRSRSAIRFRTDVAGATTGSCASVRPSDDACTARARSWSMRSGSRRTRA